MLIMLIIILIITFYDQYDEEYPSGKPLIELLLVDKLATNKMAIDELAAKVCSPSAVPELKMS